MTTRTRTLHRVNEKDGAPRPHRRTAVSVGVLLIVCTAASILSVAPLGSLLDRPVDLARLAASDNRVVLAALIEFVAAATGSGIAIALYPVLRPYGRALALGAAAARTVGGVLVLVGTLALLALLSLAQGSTSPGPTDGAATEASVRVLLAVRDWEANFLLSLPFLLGAALYYCVMYRATVVPRWLSAWGLVGVGLSLVATLSAGFTQDFGFTTSSTALNAPIALQEMVLAFWLIAKGFNAQPGPQAPSAS
ncbi:DUF4386 domain-containing protein [Angustibacter sp. Root456]|uniref:DUF4386 domain-containing protein n=1 Tax=Angustibacter sp. Root456 TaxID=1736539 RepID=UPI0007004926|nr:DUF4386 domain-containing protein [Angustibacter sp. Root456]KQX62846.1 hypothetical protein ASD06_12555 [Angustibacter sp. Root456]